MATSKHSRSAKEFLERKGIRPTRRCREPKLGTHDIRVQTTPLEQCQLDPAQLLSVQGAPPPDRGKLDPWPPPQEVSG